MEALSCLLSRAVEGTFLICCNIGEGLEGGLVVSHLLYADITLLLCGADMVQMVYLSWLLIWLEAILGLRIKLNKSEIIPMGNIIEMESLSSELGNWFFSLPLIWVFRWELHMIV